MLRLIIFLKPYSRYLLLAWLVIIMTVSSIPKLPTLKIETSRGIIRLDYFIHFCEYASLAFLAYLAYSDKLYHLSIRKYASLTVLVIFFSMVDEFHQKFIPGRYFNIKDLCSNISGIIAALIFCVLVFRYMQRN